MSSNQQLDSFTGMRSAAAIVVVFAHCSDVGPEIFNVYPTIQPCGTISVTFFFVLSAFLLTYKAFCELLPPLKKPQGDKTSDEAVLETKKDSLPFPTLAMPTKSSILYYFIRRVFRIYPAYLVALALPTITPKPTTWEDTWKRMFFLETYYAHLWTIRLELMYYSLIPVIQILCGFAMKLQNKYKKIPFLGFLIFSITGLMAWVHAEGYLIGKYLPVFWYGSLAGIAYFYCKRNGYIISKPQGRKQQVIFYGIEIAMYGLLVCMALANQLSSEAFLGEDTWLSMEPDGPHRASFGLIFFPFIWMIGVTDGNTSLARFFSCNFFVWSGKISYSMYLIQYIPLQIIANHTNIKGFEAVVLAIILVCALGWVLNTLVEEPSVKVGNWLINKHKSRVKKAKTADQTQVISQEQGILVDDKISPALLPVEN